MIKYSQTPLVLSLWHISVEYLVSKDRVLKRLTLYQVANLRGGHHAPSYPYPCRPSLGLRCICNLQQLDRCCDLGQIQSKHQW